MTEQASRLRAVLGRAGKVLAHVAPGLATVAAIGGGEAMLHPEPALALDFVIPHGPPTPPRTGGAVAQAWALGTLTEATRPNSAKPCDLDHVCALVAQSNGVAPGTGITIQREFDVGDYQFPGNLPFVLDEIIDYPHRIPNGAGRWCYPATGTLSVIVSATLGTLVLDFQGQACEIGTANDEALLFFGGYTGDSGSTGMFQNAEAIGTFNIENPSGLRGSFENMKVSFSGQLLLSDEPPPK